MLKNDGYTYRVTWSEEDNEYVGLCAEFPSLGWLAPTPEAALAGVRQVVADVVADMQASSEPVPEPVHVALIQRENFDYTIWRQTLFSGMSGEEISRQAMGFHKKK
jgi:predicted RNase H-like HicB family nuclease